MNTINTNTNINPKATTHTDATKRRNTADHDHVNDGIKADAVTSAPATFGRPVTPRNVPRATLGDPSCRPHLLPDRGPAPLSFPMPSPSDPANVPPAWVSLPDGSRYIDHAAPQAPRAQPLCAIALYEARTGERLPFRDARGALLEDPFVQQAPVVSGFDVIRHAACAVRARPEAVYAWVELGGKSCRVLPYNFIDEVVLCPHARRNEFGHVAVYVYREAPVGTQRDVRGLCAGCRRAQEAIQLMRATEQQFESRELANALDRVKAGVQRGCTPAYVAKLQEWQQELEEACAALVRSLRSAQCRCHGDEACDAAQPLHAEHWLDLYVRGLLPEPYAVGVAAEAGLTRAQDAARLHWQHRIGDLPLPGGAMLGVVPKGTRRVVAARTNAAPANANAAIAKGSDADTTPAPPPTPSRAESAAVDADVGDTSSEGAAASLAMEVASESEGDAASDSAADEGDAAHDDADTEHGAAEEEPAAQSVVEAVLSSVFDGDDDADHDDGSSDADGASLPHGARDDDVDADESRVSVLQRLFDIPAPTASFNGEPLSSESSLPPRRIQTPEKPTGSAATPEQRAPALTTTPPTLSHRPTVASTPDHMMEGHRDAAQASDRVLPAKPVATPAAAIGTEGYVPTIVLADSADTGTVTTSAKMDPPTTTPLPTNNTTAAADTPAKQPVSAAAKRAAEKEKAKQRRAAQAEREAAAQAEKKAAKAKAAAARAAKQAAREREEEALLERAVEKADASATAATAAAAAASVSTTTASPAADADANAPMWYSRPAGFASLFFGGRSVSGLDTPSKLRSFFCTPSASVVNPDAHASANGIGYRGPLLGPPLLPDYSYPGAHLLRVVATNCHSLSQLCNTHGAGVRRHKMSTGVVQTVDRMKSLFPQSSTHEQMYGVAADCALLSVLLTESVVALITSPHLDARETAEVLLVLVIKLLPIAAHYFASPVFARYHRGHARPCSMAMVCFAMLRVTLALQLALMKSVDTVAVRAHIPDCSPRRNSAAVLLTYSQLMHRVVNALVMGHPLPNRQGPVDDMYSAPLALESCFARGTRLDCGHRLISLVALTIASSCHGLSVDSVLNACIRRLACEAGPEADAPLKRLIIIAREPLQAPPAQARFGSGGSVAILVTAQQLLPSLFRVMAQASHIIVSNANASPPPSPPVSPAPSSGTEASAQEQQCWADLAALGVEPVFSDDDIADLPLV